MLKKIFCTLILLTGIGAVYSFADNFSDNEYLAYTQDTEPEFVDSAIAQDMNGTQTMNVSIYRVRTSNGRYRYFAYANREYHDLYCIMGNNYQPYYFKIGNTRWYFASKTLDTKQAYRDMPH